MSESQTAKAELLELLSCYLLRDYSLMSKTPAPDSVNPPVLIPRPSHDFLTPLQQTPNINVKDGKFEVQTPTDVEHLSVSVEADKSLVEVASAGRSQTPKSTALATPEHGSPDEVVPTTQSQPTKNASVEADKSLVEVASAGHSQTSKSTALATPEHGSPDEVVPTTQSQPTKSADILIAEQKNAFEIAPPGISVSGRNKVVPVSASNIGFETTQEMPQQAQKYTDCSKFSQLCTKLAKGQVARHSCKHPAT